MFESLIKTFEYPSGSPESLFLIKPLIEDWFCVCIILDRDINNKNICLYKFLIYCT